MSNLTLSNNPPNSPEFSALLSKYHEKYFSSIPDYPALWYPTTEFQRSAEGICWRMVSSTAVPVMLTYPKMAQTYASRQIALAKEVMEMKYSMTDVPFHYQRRQISTRYNIYRYSKKHLWSHGEYVDSEGYAILDVDLTDKLTGDIKSIEMELAQTFEQVYDWAIRDIESGGIPFEANVLCIRTDISDIYGGQLLEVILDAILKHHSHSLSRDIVKYTGDIPKTLWPSLKQAIRPGLGKRFTIPKQ